MSACVLLDMVALQPQLTPDRSAILALKKHFWLNFLHVFVVDIEV